MITKMYVKRGEILRSWGIRLSETNKLIMFDGGSFNSQIPNCKFITSDKAIQDSLEKHSQYNAVNGFELFSETNDEDVSNPEATGAGNDSAKRIANVTDLNSAKKYILENYEGYTQTDVSSTAKVRGLATKLEIEFPNWVV
jgi:hypothetical protein